MFNVTDAAAKRCAEKLDHANADDDECMRLCLTAGKPGMRRSKPQPGEALFKHQQRHVLVVSPEVAAELDGRTLDCRSTPLGERFRFIRESKAD